MSWFDRWLCPTPRQSNLEALVAKVLFKVSKLEERVIAMGAREEAAYAKLSADIQTVKDGWASLVAERDALKEALENADADAAAQVAAALEADSEVDAAKVEAADAALAELVAPPVEPEPEPES